MIKPGTIAVTGGTGFVGRHVLARLKEENLDIRSLIRQGETETLANKNVIGDLETAEGLEELCNGADLVINLVGRLQPPFKDLVNINATVLDNLCQAAKKSGVKKIIHISAAAVYGLPKDEKPFTEEDPLLPDTPYSLSKLMGEEILSFYQRNSNLQIIILRPPNIYGPGSDHGVVYNLIKSAKETGGVTIHGDGTQQRDFLYVGDLVNAIIHSLDYDSSDVFNIATSDPKDLNELTRVLGKVMQQDLKITKKGEALGAKFVSASYKKAGRLLNWAPLTSLEEGLKKTFEAA